MESLFFIAADLHIKLIAKFSIPEKKQKWTYEYSIWLNSKIMKRPSPIDIQRPNYLTGYYLASVFYMEKEGII